MRSIHRRGAFMKNLRRLTVISVLAFSILLLLPVPLWSQQRDPIIEKVAKAYGLDSYEKIEAIRYTWNIDIPGLFKATHKWEWEPKTGKITYESTDKDGKPVKVAYDSSQLNSQSDQVKNEVEPAFVNDNYWLLFPFHAYWDKSATVTNQGTKKLPIGAGSATLVSEVSPGSRRLYPGRHMGPLRQQRLPRPGNGVSPRRRQEAEPRHCNVDRLQKGWPAAC